MAGHIFIIGKWASFRGNATAGICDAEAGMRGKSISGMDFTLCGKLHEQANQHRWQNNMRSRHASVEESRLHVVSAWVKEDGVSFGQIRTEEKSNEITAIPQLLEGLDVEGGIVTIDAMGCHKAIADKIVACKANYVLAVKGNQPTLMEEMQEYFKWAETDEVERKHLAICTEDEDSRDRRVSRCITVSNDIAWFEDKAA